MAMTADQYLAKAMSDAAEERRLKAIDEEEWGRRSDEISAKLKSGTRHEDLSDLEKSDWAEIHRSENGRAAHPTANSALRENYLKGQERKRMAEEGRKRSQEMMKQDRAEQAELNQSIRSSPVMRGL